MFDHLARSQRTSLAALALSLGVAGALDAHAHAQPSSIGDQPWGRRGALHQLAEGQQRLKDQQAIRDLLNCYGTGHDLIFTRLDDDQQPALDVLERCFTPNVQSDVRFFDAPETTRLSNLNELVAFIEDFALDRGYHSARNTPGNILVEFLDDDHARVTSSTLSPHFSSAAPSDGVPPGFVDLFSARYVMEVVRVDDGSWRTEAFELNVDDVIHLEGNYPFGQ